MIQYWDNERIAHNYVFGLSDRKRPWQFVVRPSHRRSGDELALGDSRDRWDLGCAPLRTLGTIQRQIEIQISGERAWVLVDPGNIPDDFEPRPGRVAFLEVRPIIKNYGKTPAHITRVGISEDKVPAIGKLQPEPKYKHEQSVDIMLPPDLPIQL